MTQESMPLPAMSWQELFRSARAVSTRTAMASITFSFSLRDVEEGEGTLTICRNPSATRWMTTVGIAQGERVHARMAQGQTIDEALGKIERYCYWWLGV